MRVYDALCHGTTADARLAVSMIVGRDTSELTDEGVTKAAVETIAENTSDGVIAPMFYMAVGGAPLMFLYKAINTMDSMLGYKIEKYLYFGRCAAKLDDAANFLPARISGWLMTAGAFFGALPRKMLFIFSGATEESTQARTLHRRNPSWPERLGYSLQAMPVILERFMKNRLSATVFA